MLNQSSQSPTSSREIRPHYLLELVSDELVSAEAGHAPHWVRDQIEQTPFVVVRRACTSVGELENMIPVGVRGQERSQRFAAFVSRHQVKRIIAPYELLGALPSASNRELGVFAALTTLRNIWHELSSPWGPGGSVGFELATAKKTTHSASDLDIVIYSDKPLPIEQVRFLGSSLANLDVRVDVQVEAPSCAFLLAEYARDYPGEIILRTLSGPMLGVNPWQNSINPWRTVSI
ncbi:MAG: malonate decarboxylase holo-ACP synthase [Candidatus Melainabacteria bacterium]|nr:malonate decarboxylase holo-ACP synthase [Candidatus Melainabacteria bacterium]